MASRKNTELGITPFTANAWGMAIGALSVLALLTVTHQPWVLPKGNIYWAALIYLAIIGSIVGFTCYLLLVDRIGSARAGYATVMFPIVALALSTLLEGYQWTALAAVGVLCAGLGNAVMFVNDLFPRRFLPGKPSAWHNAGEKFSTFSPDNVKPKAVSGYNTSGKN